MNCRCNQLDDIPQLPITTNITFHRTQLGHVIYCLGHWTIASLANSVALKLGQY